MSALKLNFEERMALATIRKAMLREPELAAELMRGMPKEVATKVLLQVRDEIKDLLALNQVFSQAAAELAKAMPTTKEK